MMRLATVLTVLALVLSSCGEFVIDDLFESGEIANTDLTASEEPALRAAGESADEWPVIEVAEEKLREGVETLDLGLIREASQLGPDDPRYPVHELAVLSSGPIDTDDLIEPRKRARDAVAAQYPEATTDEQQRIVYELFIMAIADVLDSASVETT